MNNYTPTIRREQEKGEKTNVIHISLLQRCTEAASHKGNLQSASSVLLSLRNLSLADKATQPMVTWLIPVNLL